jgi:acetolactate synthase-1/2/3 large subunit
MMELATAVQHNVDIKIVIMTNNRLGMVRELQTNGYNDRQTAVFLDGSPDFIKLAKAYGIEAMRVDGANDVDRAIGMIADHKGICLVEVVVDEMFPSR